MDKKELIKNIDKLKDKNKYLELFKFIKYNNINYTQNSNGIFINLKVLDDEIINIINIKVNELLFK